MSTPKAFKDAKAWGAWLERNHNKRGEVWIRFFKKTSGIKSISYSESLDEALCWGWIDGHVKPFDAQSWIHRFTPRTRGSKWSKRNQEHVARLMEAGRMKAQGLAQVEAAKGDGRWAQAYSPPSQSKVPADFLRELKKEPAAEKFFKTLNRANLYAIAYRLETAKTPETRKRRFDLILAMMREGKKFHA